MQIKKRTSSVVIVLFTAVLIAVAKPEVFAAEPAANSNDLFRRENLIAWCIVPFDAKKRGPEERAAMLQKLGFRHFAYDFRAEHIPTFDAEIAACKKHGVSLDAWWFPRSLDAGALHILEVCKRNDIHPQLWVTGSGDATATLEEQKRRIEAEAARIRPIAEAAAKQGMKVGLYNHGGWFGEPENQLALIEHLKLPNVGIIYNLHHGHDHLARFSAVLPKLMPHLLAINLNGMVTDGDKRGQKILPLGQGTHDLELLRTILASGYRGPIGILGHTQDDAEARLQDNLDGLDWLLPQLDGRPAGAKPQPRTVVPKATTVSSQAAAQPAGWMIEGRDAYRTPPLSLAWRGMLTSRAHYNILVACDTKRSGAHWELFTMPQSGRLAAYLPGYQPDHVWTDVDIADGKPHEVAMSFATDRLRLYVDGKPAADQTIQSQGRPIVPGGLAFGRLVEGGIGSSGTIDQVQIWRGVRDFTANKLASAPAIDAETIGFWNLRDPKQNEVSDESTLKNPARRSLIAEVTPPKGRAPQPPPGPHLKAVDVELKTVVIDRSSSDVYMGVKVDVDGRVFVGGREAVFCFERKTDGSFAARREVLRFPPNSIIMGLEFRNDDLYVLTANALYRVPNGRVQRTELHPERLLWGLPLDLHVSFHCLAWGPDGDLYLTHGDPLLQYGDWNRADHWGHWTLYCGRDNKPLPYTGQGAVLRMKPDGSDVQVVARGLRGPVGLAFDDRGRLFTNDNDHESRADRYAPSRLLHVVDGIDFGWPRGWMASKNPERADLIEPACDLGRGVPCDLLYYGRASISPSLTERLLLCRWDRHSITAYKPERRGSTFIAKEETVAIGDENCRPVGIAADRHGNLFVTALYMTGNMAAPDCVSDLMMLVRADGKPTTMPPPATTPKETTATGTLLEDARSDDLYRRQLATSALARDSSQAELLRLASSNDEAARVAGVLAIGRRLTVPDVHSVPPAQLSLFYLQGSSYFHRKQRFFGDDREIDLADLGRIGSFTIAQWWGAVERTPEQEQLFAALVASLNDSADRVRLQAAYWLSLLNDPRSEALVASTRRDVQLRQLLSAPPLSLAEAWTIGPFGGGDAGKQTPAHGPEVGPIDLSKTYGDLSWRVMRLANTAALSPSLEQASQRVNYYHFRIQSGVRQPALLTASAVDVGKLWQNEILVAAVNNGVGPRQWILDLQPGSNDLLLQLPSDEALNHSLPNVRLHAVHPTVFALPEKLDAALLSERLRSAALTGNSQPVPGEFSAVDWAKSSRAGNAAAGRKLFASLGCAKCHAVAPDQKSAGAPSLFEAKRRFTIPHLVESVLLPSRQVAELFRAQTFVTDDGRTLTGLVTTETADAVELLMPDASRPTLAKKIIEERSPTQLSPMPQGLVKTPDELRDLLAYLLSDNPTPP